MAAHTCEHDVWIGYKCRLCGGRAKPRPMLAPPPAPMTIHPEDLREKETDPGEYPPPCSDPGGHVWVCRDGDEEVSYCEHCGADGNA